MALVGSIKVDGLHVLQKGLKEVDRDLAKELRKGLNLAAGIVVEDVQRLVPIRSGAARASVKAGSTQRAAIVKAGGRKAPWYPWLDFGGRVGRRKSIRRTFIQGGRYIYPTVRRRADDIGDTLDEVIGDLLKQAGV